jgi:hypothetical protein
VTVLDPSFNCSGVGDGEDNWSRTSSASPVNGLASISNNIGVSINASSFPTMLEYRSTFSVRIAGEPKDGDSRKVGSSSRLVGDGIAGCDTLEQSLSLGQYSTYRTVQR